MFLVRGTGIIEFGGFSVKISKAASLKMLQFKDFKK
jgi:hypothetical protein